jgi:prophage regulatory protein
MKSKSIDSQPPVYLDVQSVAAFVTLSVPTIHVLVRKDQFPKPRLLSGHRVAWLRREVEEWAEARPISNLLPPPNAGTGRRKSSSPKT